MYKNYNCIFRIEFNLEIINISRKWGETVKTDMKLNKTKYYRLRQRVMTSCLTEVRQR